MSSINYSPTFQGLKNQPQQTKKYKYNDAFQSNVGYFAGTAVSTGLGLCALPIADKMIKINHNIAPDKAAEIFEHAKTALKNSGLGEKVSFEVIKDAKNISPITQAMVEKIDKMKLPKTIKNFMKMNIPEHAAATGKNAFFAPFANKIVYNPEKIALAPFHEIGHAMNWNTKWGKAIQLSRNPLMALAGTITLLALSAKSKSRVEHQEQQTGKPQKKGFMSFIRDNAGKLTFASMLPVVIEEGIASYRGAKLAKPLLSPEMFKKMNKANILALGTYVLGAVAMGLGAWAGVKIKDKLVANKIAKQEAQNRANA